MNILVFNPGSATLKFGLYQLPAFDKGTIIAESATMLAKGSIEPVGEPQSVLKMLVATEPPVIEPIEATTLAQSVKQIIRHLPALVGRNNQAPFTIDAIGCRVVHGGTVYVEPTRVTPSVLDGLRALGDLAPLHNPEDVAVLEELRGSLPHTPLVAVFDTAFHQTLPPVAYNYALPAELSARYKLRRYGFHGISHAYVSEQLIEHLGRGAPDTKVITCHLGSGASVCAVRDGQSIDTSMGFTPVEGLVMGTRSGDVDPGLILYLIRTAGMTAGEVDSLLNHRSGLRGLSELSADVRDLEQAAHKGDERAKLALEVFAYRARKYIGAFAAALEGLDGVAFTAGIGENSASIRRRICHGLGFLGLQLDDDVNEAANGRVATRISADRSSVQIWVIPTDEERQIALSTYEQLHH